MKIASAVFQQVMNQILQGLLPRLLRFALMISPFIVQQSSNTNAALKKSLAAVRWPRRAWVYHKLASHKIKSLFWVIECQHIVSNQTLIRSLPFSSWRSLRVSPRTRGSWGWFILPRLSPCILNIGEPLFVICQMGQIRLVYQADPRI